MLDNLNVNTEYRLSIECINIYSSQYPAGDWRFSQMVPPVSSITRFNSQWVVGSDNLIMQTIKYFLGLS